jgi:myo-inositol catabolism protein IolC
VADQLFLLASDHRGSLMESFFGVEGVPSPEEETRARRLKLVVWEGLERALRNGLPLERAGMLADPTYGREVITAAQRRGVRVATPVEASGRQEFEFEVPGWKERLDELDPTWAKVLVRYNPEGDGERNARQRRSLREVSEHCAATGRGFLFELLVPPEPSQLETVDGDATRYDTDIRPGLMVRAIAELQRAGIEPDIWKIEGLERSEDCEAVAVAARTEGRDRVGCVVLGHGADTDAVDRWLRAGANVPGFVGFAIGRSVWWEPLRTFFEAGAGDDAAEVASSEIARRYLHFVDVFTDGSAA